MKLALLTVNGGRGGVVNVVWTLAEVMRNKYGFEVDVLCDRGSETHRLEKMGVRHVPIGFNRGPRNFLAARAALRKYFREHRPDVVHSHSRWPTIVSRTAGVTPDVSTLHMDRITHAGSFLDRFPFRQAAPSWGKCVTVLDSASKARLLREFSLTEQRVVVVPNGVDDERFRPVSREDQVRLRDRTGIPPNAFVLVFSGAFIPRKNPSLMLHAVSRIKENVHPWLLWIGEGPERAKCEKLADDLGLAHTCVFAGWTDTPEELLSSADAFILTSDVEGFPLAVVEAMLCGLPIVRTRGGGSSEQIIEGQTGWSVEPGDVAGFAEKIFLLIQDRERARQMGEAARARAKNLFTETKMIKTYHSLYTRSLT